MELGFSEPSYRILRRYRRPLLSNVSGNEFFELRQHGDTIPYIAIFAVNPKGKQFRDDLLMYDDHVRVADDWTLLTSKPNAKPNELGYCERTIDHSAGYRRDGAFKVY